MDRKIPIQIKAARTIYRRLISAQERGGLNTASAATRKNKGAVSERPIIGTSSTGIAKQIAMKNKIQYVELENFPTLGVGNAEGNKVVLFN
jgi:hypothetical protein